MPFVTFYYKLAPRLLEVAAKYPWRFAPYVGCRIPDPAACRGSAGGPGPDDQEKLKKALPEWLRDKQHVYVLPWKDENGRWQFLDLSYLVPWTMFTDAAKQAVRTESVRSDQDGRPLHRPDPRHVTAIRSNKDAFTGRDIANPGDPTNASGRAWLTYLYNMAMPPVLTNRGLIGPDFGSPAYATSVARCTRRWSARRTSSAIRAPRKLRRCCNAVGISMYPINPE
jgi:hypothetical protein